jgi:septum formation protein
MTAIANRKLILGSTSTYRRELLGRLRVPFSSESPGVEELHLQDEAPAAMATRLARAKAQAVSHRFPGAIVIGSDQVADLDGQALGKPGTHDRAVAQLQMMRGRTVTFQTAVSVMCLETNFSQTELATVKARFRMLSDPEIESYLRAEQPYDCAGSAKSEGLGILLLDSIENDDPTALIGLPLIRTSQMLRAAGFDFTLCH